MNKFTLLALLPEWIFGGIILLIIYKAPRLWLKLGEVGGWILFLGAPVLAEIITEVMQDTVGLRSWGLDPDSATIFFAVCFVCLGFASIASSKLLLWASGQDTSAGVVLRSEADELSHAEAAMRSKTASWWVGFGFFVLGGLIFLKSCAFMLSV